MIRLLARLVLGVLVVLQSAAPALASDWVAIDDSCGCALECGCCEPIVMECEACDECASEVVASDDCGCSTTEHAEPTMEKAAEPVPAETNKPETTKAEKPAEVQPQTETPAPTLEKPATELPPAPIAVPAETAPAPSGTDELFPGPAVTPSAEAPATLPQPEPKTNADGLFDEPAATVEEPAAEAEVTETEETQTTEELFVEPSQPAADEAEEEETETETETVEAETEEPAAESNPLDELFGPSTPPEEPAPAEEPAPKKEEYNGELESIDPFSWNETPTLEIVPGLANSPSRTWTDLGANVHCEARLVRMTTTGVHLTQASGELVILDFSQLSDTDLNFVREQIRAQRALLAPTHLAARPQ